jgi:hypothetical protein
VRSATRWPEFGRPINRVELGHCERALGADADRERTRRFEREVRSAVAAGKCRRRDRRPEALRETVRIDVLNE